MTISEISDDYNQCCSLINNPLPLRTYHGMAEEVYRVFTPCLFLLRLSGMACYKFSKTGESLELSRVSLVFNILVFITLSCNYFTKICFGCVYNVSSSAALNISYPMYTKILGIEILLLIFLENIYSAKFGEVVKCLKDITERMQKICPKRSESDKKSLKIILAFVTWYILTILLNRAILSHLPDRFPDFFRRVSYFALHYGLILSLHFFITIRFIKCKLVVVNKFVTRQISQQTQRQQQFLVKQLENEYRWFLLPRLKLAAVTGIDTDCTEKLDQCFSIMMELKQTAEMTNSLFEKPIFLTLTMAFMGVIINTYLVSKLNMDRWSDLWLNLLFFTGQVQCSFILMINFSIGEMATNEVSFVSYGREVSQASTTL